MLRYRADNLTVTEKTRRNETAQQLGAKEENHQEHHRNQPDRKQKRSDDILHQNIGSSLAAGVEGDERIQTRFLVIPRAECFL